MPSPFCIASESLALPPTADGMVIAPRCPTCGEFEDWTLRAQYALTACRRGTIDGRVPVDRSVRRAAYRDGHRLELFHAPTAAAGRREACAMNPLFGSEQPGARPDACPFCRSKAIGTLAKVITTGRIGAAKYVARFGML